MQQRVGRRRQPWREIGDCGTRALAAGHDLLHVVARAECGIGPGYDEASHRRVAHRIFEFAISREGQRVARLGTPESYHANVSVNVVAEFGVHTLVAPEKFRVSGSESHA